MTVQLWCVIINSTPELINWLGDHPNRHVIYVYENCFVLDISQSEARELREYPWVSDVVTEDSLYNLMI